MLLLLTLFIVVCLLFSVLKIKLTVLFWILDKTVKKVKNTINFEVIIIINFDTWSLLKMEMLFSKLKFK